MKRRSNFKKRVSQGIYDVFYIWRREIHNVFYDQGVLIFCILVPLGYPLLYSFIYNNEVVREIPTIAVDESHTQLSREFLRKVDATPDVQIIAYSNDLADAQQAMKEHKAYGIVRIPSDFSKNINSIRQAHVNIYSDMGSLFYYKGILSACSGVSLDMNKKIKIERMERTTDREEEIAASPIDYGSVFIFNPTYGFAVFLIPAVLMLILQQTLVLGVGLSAGTACEHNRFKDLVPINRHYNGTLRIVFGKGLCYFMIYMIMSVWVVVAVPRIFQLNHLAPPSTLLMFMIAYILACVFFAMTASVLVRNREKCMILFAFFSVPLLFISGVSWPGSSIPTFWRIVSYLFPSTFGINGFVRINNMGATLQDVQFEYHALWIQCGVYFILACYVYRWQIQTSRRHIIHRYRQLKAQHRLNNISN